MLHRLMPSVTQAQQLGWDLYTPFECTALSANSGQTGASPSWRLCQLVYSHPGCGAASSCEHLSRSASLQVHSCSSRRGMPTARQQALSGCTHILPPVWWIVSPASALGRDDSFTCKVYVVVFIDTGVAGTCLCFCGGLGLPSVNGAGWLLSAVSLW